MGTHVIKVPDIGEGIAEVELVEWHVQPGDTVEVDQVLADLMTDKATVEVPTPVAGRVVAFGGKAGDKLAVGAELLRVEMEGTSASAAPKAEAPAARAAAPTPAVAAARPAATVAAAPAAAPALAETTMPQVVGKPLASPSVRRHARELAVDLKQVRGTGPDGRIVHDDVVRFAARGAKPASVARYAQR